MFSYFFYNIIAFNSLANEGKQTTTKNKKEHASALVNSYLSISISICQELHHQCITSTNCFDSGEIKTKLNQRKQPQASFISRPPC